MASAPQMKKLGVVLLNMGGPTSLDAVRPFLQNLFLDREIISFGPMEFARRPLAWFIAKRRAEVVKGNYAQIGGRSPIAELSRKQGEALERRLADRLAGRAEVMVRIGFSYWHPFIAEAFDELDRAGCDRVFLMPLYPHYSKTTTGSCFKTWRDLHRAKGNRRFRVTSVKEYPTHPSFVEALSRRIDEALEFFPAERRDREDVLAGDPSILMRPELYVTAAALAAGLFVGLSLAGVASLVAALIAVVAGFGLRGAAIARGWSLPAYRN